MSDDLKPPVARYRLELVITGNTIEELARELDVQSNDFAYEAACGRTEHKQWGGRHHLYVDEVNPTMTPEQYDDDLRTWAKRPRT